MIQEKKPAGSKMSSVPRRTMGLGAIGRNLAPKTPDEAMSNVEIATRKMGHDEDSQKISRCIERYERHLENVRAGVSEGILDEHELINAILDFPLPSLANSLIVEDGRSEPLERLMNETNNERVRGYAKEKLDLAISFIDALF